MSHREIQTELNRITHRLQTMPLARIDESVISLVNASARRIVDLTPDPTRPADAVLPLVGPTALAAQLTIVVRDYLDTTSGNETTAASEDAAVVETLTELRRSLP